jgi:hypothetical protein
MKMHTEQWWNNNDRGIQKYWWNDTDWGNRSTGAMI